MLIGTVVEVRSDQARIDTGEELPRFVPIEVREAKGLPDLKIGDGVEITVNDQNLLVDVHLIGDPSHHRVVEGQRRTIALRSKPTMVKSNRMTCVRSLN
jgi:hypothetical protein